ncbi:MAG: hypothetical protein NZ874_00040 [Fimbriimonadales bacterium]|nr:hypothetical protein [Fimbriimonadales bacterium]
MKRTLVSLIAAIALTSTAYVQVYRDDFNGGFSLGWRWTLPDNDPFCTLFDNATGFNAENGTLVIQMRDGAMFSGFNTHKNVPSLCITRPVPDDWYVEVRLRLDWTDITNARIFYSQAGLFFGTGARDYFQLLAVQNANPPEWGGQRGTIYGSTNVETNNNFSWGGRVSADWFPVNSDPITGAPEWISLRVRHIPLEQRIVFEYRRGNGEWRPFDGCCGDSYRATGEGRDWADEFYFVLTNLLLQRGNRIGLYTDNAGGGFQTPVEFDYFETNIPVSPLGDINCDGCINDLDLLQILLAFGNTGDCLAEDVNYDGTVNDLDLLLVLLNFGTGC